MILEINNKTGCKVEKYLLEKIFQSTIRKTKKFEILSGKKVSVSVALVSLDEIRQINKKYRKKDTPTDILSFSNFENLSEKEKIKKNIFLGEIILCCEYIKKSAKINNMSFSAELCYIFSHGVLHLLGIRHGKEMFSIQDSVVGLFFAKKCLDNDEYVNPKIKK